MLVDGGFIVSDSFDFFLYFGLLIRKKLYSLIIWVFKWVNRKKILKYKINKLKIELNCEMVNLKKRNFRFGIFIFCIIV